MGNNSAKFHFEYATPYRPVDPLDDNIDIKVHLGGGEVYWGTLFTVGNVNRLLSQSNEGFFWAVDMVIVPDLLPESIEAAIRNLVESGLIEKAFSRIDS